MIWCAVLISVTALMYSCLGVDGKDMVLRLMAFFFCISGGDVELGKSGQNGNLTAWKPQYVDEQDVLYTRMRPFSEQFQSSCQQKNATIRSEVMTTVQLPRY